MHFQCVIVGTILTFSTMGFAQVIEQDTRVEDAKLACAAADVTKGIRLLAELYTATRDPIWIFNQARCYQQNAQLDLALSRFKEYLRKCADLAFRVGKAPRVLNEGGESDDEVHSGGPGVLETGEVNDGQFFKDGCEIKTFTPHDK